MPGGWVPPPPAPQPGIVPLRPLGVGELLEGALGFIRSNPRTILGLATILAIVVGALQTLGTWAALAALAPVADGLVTADVPAELAGELSDMLTLSAAQALPGLVTGLLQVVASGLFIVLLAAAVLGRALDAGSTWRRLRPRLLALIGLTLILVLGGLAMAALALGGALVAVAWLGPVGGLIAVVLTVVLGVTVLVVYVRVAVAAPALVLEGVGSARALTRSWHLTRGSGWRVLGVLVLTALITGLLTAVVSVPVSLLTSVVVGFEPSLTTAVVSSGITSLVAGIVTWPFTAAVSGLLYVDLRMRREHLDQALVVAAGTQSAAVDPIAVYRLP